MDFFSTNHLPGITVKTQQGEEYLWFSGTDYLGMGHNEDFRRLLAEGTKDYGMHFGSSRNGSLRLAVYEDAERSFAEFVQTESALLVSSGMWAGQLVMKEIRQVMLRESGLSVRYHYAPKVHPALWGDNFQAASISWHEWALKTVSLINNSEESESHIICSDAIGSPFVESFDFQVFNQIRKSANVRLIVDESHSLGVLGENGTGIGAQIPDFLIKKTIFVSSLNKALGIPAGVIWGDETVINALRKSPWFAGASPPAPAYVFAFNELLKNNSYAIANRSLKDNIHHFSEILSPKSAFMAAAQYPVFCSLNADLFPYLLKNGIMGSCFAYPSPADPPVTRIAISAAHQKEDLNRLAEVCSAFFEI